MNVYKAIVVRVIDGDTMELNIDLGFKIWFKTPTRFYGVNSPELHSSIPEEKVKAQEAKKFTSDMFPPGTEVILESKELDKYGRALGIITKIGEKKSINEQLLEKKLAVKYIL